MASRGITDAETLTGHHLIPPVFDHLDGDLQARSQGLWNPGGG